MKISAALGWMFGGLLIVFGLLICLGTLIGWSEQGEARSAVDVFLFVLLGLAPTVGGFWLCYRTWQGIRERKAERLEALVLEMAQRHHGELTVAKLAMESELSLPEAKKVLGDLFTHGFCKMDMDEAGTIVYRFDDLAARPPAESGASTR